MSLKSYESRRKTLLLEISMYKAKEVLSSQDIESIRILIYLCNEVNIPYTEYESLEKRISL